MNELKITESFIVEKIKEFLINNSDWCKENIVTSSLHGHGADLILTKENNKEKFIIECKGKSYAKSHQSINKEGWLNALGQIITRMNKINVKGDTKIKYGLGLCSVSAIVALKRIPNKVAKTLNLYIFSCDDDGNIKMYTPHEIGKNLNK